MVKKLIWKQDKDEPLLEEAGAYWVYGLVAFNAGRTSTKTDSPKFFGTFDTRDQAKDACQWHLENGLDA